MTIEFQVIPYEILFRFNQDGTLSGCHRRDLKILVDTETNEVHSAKELDPQPITGDAMEQVLGQVNTGLLATNYAYQDQFIQLDHDKQLLEAQIEDANQQVSELTAGKNQSDAMVQELTQLIESKNQEIIAKSEALQIKVAEVVELQRLLQEYTEPVDESFKLEEIQAVKPGKSADGALER